ncbi:amino acid adenylation domain-containing protein [Sorangium sp. So ce1504]|uniref:amino acid adenylation domain-containing protein n=1 Tax=Sorangium sp. So ce1504 TaxID=3133337 RepID=UPI003F5FB1CC
MSQVARVLPLSPAQQPIWLGHQLDPESAAYNVASVIAVEGTLDHSTLLRALARAVNEADVLRARFREIDGDEQGAPVQVIEPELAFDCPLSDLRAHPSPEAEARAWMEWDLAARIDLGSGRLFSTRLFLLGERRSWWYFKSHHIALDGFAMSMFFKRVAELYSCLASGKEISPTPFGPLAALIESEQAYQGSDAHRRDRAYWRGKCSRGTDVASFTSEVALPSRSFLRCDASISQQTVARLQRMAEGASAHWVPVLIAAFGVFLSRVSGRQQVVLGIPFLNRLGSIATRIPSTMANVLPLHVRVRPGDTVRDVLASVSGELSQMRLHQRYRAEDVRRDCNLLGEDRRLTGPQINVDLFTSDLDFGGQRGAPEMLSAGPADDLSFLVQPGAEGEGLRLIGMANPALYREEELRLNIARFLEFLERFAEGVDTPVGRLDAFTSEERRFFFAPKPAAGAARAAGGVETGTLIGAFERRAIEAPEAVALTFGDEHITYAELDARANRLASAMADAADFVGNPRIALLIERSVETIVAILAAFKVGAAYVPIDPDAPSGRIDAILADTQPVLLLADAYNMRKLGSSPFKTLVIEPDKLASARPATAGLTPWRRAAGSPSADDLAYIIYTSGSTGKPKGVKITHHNVVRLFKTTDRWFEYRCDDVWTQCFSYVFDASVWEIWGALLHGARLVMVPPEIARAPEALLELIVKEKVTVFGQIPSAFYRLMEAEEDRPELASQLSLRYQCFGGEALDLGRLKPWFSRHEEGKPKLLNMYGITETTINVTYQFVTRSQVLAESGSFIGRAYDDLRVMVLDDALRPVPIGGYGEMYVAGEGLAPGYLNRPDLDAVRFVADPYGPPGSRMYRSGDVAVLHEDGLLEYVGRSDQQVKVRGYRIELGEIESHLRDHPAISDAVASVQVDTFGDPKLVAHVVPATDAASPRTVDADSLRDYLRERLPPYMVPHAIGVLAALPFNQNGKVDRRALPEIKVTSERRVEPARDALDERVIEVWRGHLGVERLGIDDNFFELGGDSIKAIRVCRTLGMPVMTLFKDPTPRACADFLRAGGDAAEQKQGSFLHAFGRGAGDAGINLLCVPFAGGNALAFRQLAEGLPGSVACWSVNLPGHDPTRPGEELLSIDAVADGVVKEVMASIKGPIAVYGHCAGNAIALAVASKLESAGAELVELVIGAMLPDDDPQAVLSGVSGRTGRDIITFLRSLGGFKDVLDEDTLAAIADMTKHDSMETATFFATRASSPQRLAAPIHVVVGDSDPLTEGYQARYLDWRAFSEQVSLSVIEGGGHYFVTDRAAALAEILERRLLAHASLRGGRAPRKLRPFYNPFDEADSSFWLLANEKGQRSLWPQFAEIPVGWRVELGPASREACMEALAPQGGLS